jgi:hypothetical protein
MHRCYKEHELIMLPTSFTLVLSASWHMEDQHDALNAVQTTLVNFCVTEKGLEDQLLALVVEHERPDLQEQAQALVKQLGQFTITLKSLEDNLLTRLANSQGDILEDTKLIENLEETKRTAVRRLWASTCTQVAACSRVVTGNLMPCSLTSRRRCAWRRIQKSRFLPRVRYTALWPQEAR